MPEYLRYTLYNEEPLRISDASTSQMGQTSTITYIPGSAIRGYVIGKLSGQPWFEDKKKELLSGTVRFMNAYLTVPAADSSASGNRKDRDGQTKLKELIPSPKGFYEDKTQAEVKDIQNVATDGNFSDGMKRASLGRYAYFEDEKIRYYTPETGSDLKIKINVSKDDQNVFRNEYLSAGQYFTGYIAVEDASLKKSVQEAVGSRMILGNGRSAGLGKCAVTECTWTRDLPYGEFAAKTPQSGEFYLYLLSDTVMRDENGDPCGLDLEVIQKILNVSDLKIAYCATSTVAVQGYNRTWGTRVPGITMYEHGSVFHLTFSGTASAENMLRLMHEGLGIRRNEGFGRVLIFDSASYEKLTKKQKGVQAEKLSALKYTQNQPDRDEKEQIRLIAGNYYRELIHEQMIRYIVKYPLDKAGISDSQLGMIESILIQNRYRPTEAIRVLDDYLAHAQKKADSSNIQKNSNSAAVFKRYRDQIIEKPLDELLQIPKIVKEKGKVMGIPVSELLDSEDTAMFRVQLMIEAIRYDNKTDDRKEG